MSPPRRQKSFFSSLFTLFSLLLCPSLWADEWSLNFQVSIPDQAADKGALSFNLKAGMGSSTTDGFDGATDVMALLAGPLQAAFSHEGDPAYPPHLQEIWTDMRGEGFPQSWTIRIRSMQNQFPVLLEWTLPPVFQFDFCRVQSIQLMDEVTGLPVDLGAESFLSYSSSGNFSAPDVRDFTLSATSTPQNSPLSPTGLRGSRRGQIVKLSWDKINDPAVTGVRLWRRAEGEPGWTLLTPEPFDGRRFSDIGTRRGFSYVYSISAVGENGCESLLSDEILVYPKGSRSR